jgi:hypothetical protein
MQQINLYHSEAPRPHRLIQVRIEHTSSDSLASTDSCWGLQLTMLSPKIMLHQKRTLFNRVRPLTHLLRCNITIGIWSIIAMKP